MKKINYLVILLSFLSLGQVQSQTRSIHSQQKSQYDTKASTSFASEGEARNYVAEIISVVGLKANFELQASDIPNAAAVIYSGKRYVLYNPTFINNLTKTAGNKWAAISILAHEVGHHLNGHTLENIGSHPAIELEADEFSGFVLRRMGATLVEAQQAMQIAADYKRSSTHPGKTERLVAIAGGWNNADDQMKGKKTDIAKTVPVKDTNPVQNTDIARNDAPSTNSRNRTYPTPSRDNSNENNGEYNRGKVIDARTVSQRTAIDPKYIIGDVSFLGDKGATYYVTTKLNLVKVENNQLYVLGKVAQSGDNNYPYLVTLANAQKLWVSTIGNIVTSSGLKVGEMRGR